MTGFGWVHKISRGAGRGKGRRHLTSDMTGFAHARHNDAARRRQHQPDCAHESIAQLRGQSPGALPLRYAIRHAPAPEYGRRQVRLNYLQRQRMGVQTWVTSEV